MTHIPQSSSPSKIFRLTGFDDNFRVSSTILLTEGALFALFLTANRTRDVINSNSVSLHRSSYPLRLQLTQRMVLSFDLTYQVQVYSLKGFLIVSGSNGGVISAGVLLGASTEVSPRIALIGDSVTGVIIRVTGDDTTRVIQDLFRVTGVLPGIRVDDGRFSLTSITGSLSMDDVTVLRLHRRT